MSGFIPENTRGCAECRVSEWPYGENGGEDGSNAGVFVGAQGGLEQLKAKGGIRVVYERRGAGFQRVDAVEYPSDIGIIWLIRS
jgi:hypothetical protein